MAESISNFMNDYLPLCLVENIVEREEFSKILWYCFAKISIGIFVLYNCIW